MGGLIVSVLTCSMQLKHLARVSPVRRVALGLVLASCATGTSTVEPDGLYEAGDDRCDPRGWPRLEEEAHSTALCGQRGNTSDGETCHAAVTVIVQWLNGLDDEAARRPECLQHLGGPFEPFATCMAFPSMSDVDVVNWHARNVEGRLVQLALTVHWRGSPRAWGFVGGLADGGCGTGTRWTTEQS